MTPTFAIVAEGPSDFLVLRQILATFFADPDIVANQLQPAVDATGGRDSPGGWYEVFRFLGSDRLTGAFEQNAYVVIHIDTDVCEEPHFGVWRRHPGGQELTVDEMPALTIDRLVKEIGPDTFQRFQARIIFAVAVESIECWLLPLYCSGKQREKTVNCLNTLNAALNLQEKFSIDVNAEQVRNYRKVVKRLTKRKELDACSPHNPGFRAFIDALEAIPRPP